MLEIDQYPSGRSYDNNNNNNKNGYWALPGFSTLLSTS